jgi:hypothetical protein
VVDSKGNLTDLVIGEEYSGEAPVTVRFYANAREIDGYSLTCTWEFFKEGEIEPYLVRHDADVQIELRESGATTVMLSQAPSTARRSPSLSEGGFLGLRVAVRGQKQSPRLLAGSFLIY